MRRLLPSLLLAAAVTAAGCGPAPPGESAEQEDDPYLWLEEVDGERALAWVEERNAATAARLAGTPLFEELLGQARAVLDSHSRLPRVTQRAGWLYNFWRDETNPRGLYRRTTLAGLRSDQPDWQTVLDVDALAESEGEKWVFKGMSCLPEEYRHCLVFLSPGGGDAVTVREFDMETLEFVSDGFALPLAKSRVSWRDRDTLFVGTDFGDGSMTESGYPRIVKLWRRGEPLTAAETLLEGASASVSVRGDRYFTDDGEIDLVTEATTFWRAVRHHLLDGALHRLALPETAVVADAYRGRLLVELKEPWTVAGATHPAGSLVLVAPDSLHPGAAPEVEPLVRPDWGTVVEDAEATPEGILVTLLDDVRGRLHRYREDGDGWRRETIPFPDNGALSVTSVDAEDGSFFVQYQSFTTPPTLYYVAGPGWQPQAILAQDPTFDGSRFLVEQHFATSADGTLVPYFEVRPREAALDGG
ncbi:MAG: S9 family peptidase, partial [Thermoanaerobaculia bacterium]|nr:S9 family peptidase [Thermoanaerobaculia bacterium]